MSDAMRVQFDASVPAKAVDLTIETGAEPLSCFFRSDDILLTPRADALVAAALIPAMKVGRSLHIHGPLSRRLQGHLPAVQKLYHNWYPDLMEVPVNSLAAVPRSGAEPSGRRTGLFFSGGVDSFYTLLKHRDEITDLIFVHGFDVPVDQRELAERIALHLRTVADGFGKRLVRIQTDVRGMLSPFGDWGALTHGAALAAVAHLLPDTFGKVYIGSSYFHEYQVPWGSHPQLDPLWSSDVIDFVHDGCEARRFDKINLISDDVLAMKFLRVCWKNRGGAYNCCRCEKCLRTMLDLQAAGALPHCSAFDRPLKPGRVRWMKEHYPGGIQSHLEKLPDIPENRSLRRALYFAERRNQVRRWIKQGC